VSVILNAGLGAFARRVREALAAPEGALLATLFTAPLVTALVVDLDEARSDPRLAQALLEVRDALERVGVPRGRQFVLVGRDAPGALPFAAGRAEGLSEQLSLRVLLHDPAGAVFTAGRLPTGEAVQLDDELREAEAIVCIGRGEAAAGHVSGGPYLLVPGVASLATRQAFAERRAEAGERGAVAFALGAETQAPVDLALLWDADGQVRAGRGRTQFAALAHAAGFA
jgi:hypothetical protein